ncbi:MAG: ornithine carbamoyltransferase [Armatimonadetes bacterium]|nr:ornithine carbamoyltransferase [Armatimonadota bacterium]
MESVSLNTEIAEKFLKENSLIGRDFLSMSDLSASELRGVLAVAAAFKAYRREGRAFAQLPPFSAMAMIFEKPSLRTRVTFELAMDELGGSAVMLSGSEIGLGTREPIRDIGANLSRWVSAITARVTRHQTLVDMAEAASAPVINALSDREHPCQATADLLTILEKAPQCDKLLHSTRNDTIKVAFIGDGNNVAQSLMLGCVLLGIHIVLACPPGYEPGPDLLQKAKLRSVETGGSVEVTHNPAEAIIGSAAVVTDVWTSMGQEAEREKRLRSFADYQLNAQLLAKALPEAIVLHCLPAHRGEEITADVLEGPQSAVLDEAENRLHAQKSVIALLLGASPVN